MPFYVYIATITAKLVRLQKYMIVAIESGAPSCIIHACDEETYLAEIRSQTSTQCDLTKSIHAVYYKPLKHRAEQMDRHDAVKESEGNAGIDWRDELKLQNKYVAYRHLFVNVLAQFENTRDSHLGQLRKCSLNRT